jgi:hypothetical protein
LVKVVEGGGTFLSRLRRADSKRFAQLLRTLATKQKEITQAGESEAAARQRRD